MALLWSWDMESGTTLANINAANGSYAGTGVIGVTTDKAHNGTKSLYYGPYGGPSSASRDGTDGTDTPGINMPAMTEFYIEFWWWKPSGMHSGLSGQHGFRIRESYQTSPAGAIDCVFDVASSNTVDFDLTHGTFGSAFGQYQIVIPENQWFLFGLYGKMNTSGSTNGIFKIWINGALTINATAMKYSNTSYTWNSWKLVTNYDNGSAVDYWYNDEFKLYTTVPAGDTTAPILSSASVGSVTTTTGIPSVVTNEVGGTIYHVVVPNADVPLVADVKLGHQSNGTAAIRAENKPVIVVGLQVFTQMTGLTAGLDMDDYFLHTDTAGNDSLLLKADFRTLDAGPGPGNDTGVGTGTLLFAEPFANSNFSARGWYDGNDLAIDSTVFPPGSSSSLKFHWGIGDTTPVGGSLQRHLFPASDRIYISYYMKLGTAAVPWQGSGLAYHPHFIQMMTDAEPHAFTGPSSSYLSVLIEPHGFIPLTAISDSARINVPQLGVNMLGSATTHSVAGGNGVPPGSNYSEFTSTFDATEWTYGNPGGQGNGTNAFINDTWHHVEEVVIMNTISGGLPLGNGTLKQWVDGSPVINVTNVELRTAQYATQRFNQFLLVPYIGAGSPIAQDLWIGRLEVWTDRSESFVSFAVPKSRRMISLTGVR